MKIKKIGIIGLVIGATTLASSESFANPMRHHEVVNVHYQQAQPFRPFYRNRPRPPVVVVVRRPHQRMFMRHRPLIKIWMGGHGFRYRYR